jgi:predicted amino acid dehydrogenase
VIGLGSIGSAVLALLLQRMPHPPRIVLCDAAGSAARLQMLAQAIGDAAGYRGAIEVVEAHAGAPEPVYQAHIIVGASSAPGILAVDRLRPGTIVVDDSFPACLDTTAAIQRMRTAGDVLITGGGLLSCSPSRRIVHLPIGDTRVRERIVAELPPGATASCQLESLLLAGDPQLPPTLGLVAMSGVLRYWDALLAGGFSAAPLHLRGFRPDAALLAGLHP